MRPEVGMGGIVNIFSYVVDHDNGREPNPYFDICTLCRCKYSRKAEESNGRKGQKNIVESAKAGDWIIGTGGSSKRSVGHGKLIYAMQVDEKITREKFYEDKRFAKKMPERPSNDFQRHQQFALVSMHFYYFGSNAIEIPEHLRGLEKKGPGFRYVNSEDFLPFLEWLRKKHKPGKHGEPRGKVLDEQAGDSVENTPACAEGSCRPRKSPSVSEKTASRRGC
jgi:hypothetical protein